MSILPAPPPTPPSIKTLFELSPLWDTINKEVSSYNSPFYFKDVFQHLQGVQTWYPTGSYYICSPQVVDTDKDFVVLIDVPMLDFSKALAVAGYKFSGDESYQLGADGDFEFECYRKGDVNLIVTADAVFYNKWIEATELAKNMKLNNKDQRIRLFQYVLYGNTTLKGE